MMPGMPGMPPPGMGMMPGMPYPDPGAAAAASSPVAADGKGKTTVMWKNIPNNYTRDDLLRLVDSEGFAGNYDFFYSPVDFTSNALVGYAFVNFVSTEAANRFYDRFE